MNSPKFLWTIAVVITLAIAVYQRVTGPTYPVNGSADIGADTARYRFARSHGGESDYEVSVTADNAVITGILKYKRYKTGDPWTEIPMERDGASLKAFLPHQPPAGKLLYSVTLTSGSESVTLPGNDPVIIRFKGAVPVAVTITHVIIMFASMLVATRAGFEALLDRHQIKKLTYWSAGLLLAGGLIMGPLMQVYAFGELWTGFPFGHDLTDTKTLVSMIVWIIAVAACLKSKNPRPWVLAAFLLQLMIFIIPHSVLGSELDYSTLTENPH